MNRHLSQGKNEISYLYLNKLTKILRSSLKTLVLDSLNHTSYHSICAKSKTKQKKDKKKYCECN